MATPVIRIAKPKHFICRNCGADWDHTNHPGLCPNPSDDIGRGGHSFDEVASVEPEPVDESAIAQRDRAVDALRAVLKRLVNRRDHMFADEQQVLNEADALCVESESW